VRLQTSDLRPQTFMSFRTERDPLGELPVPADAYYGVQTQRAIENFPISGLRAPADLVVATILVKKAAAEANAALGRLDRDIAAAILDAADEILSGRPEDGPDASAGCRADHPRAGVQRIRRLRAPRSRGRPTRIGTAGGAEHRGDGGRHELERGRRIPAARGAEPRAIHEPSPQAGV